MQGYHTCISDFVVPVVRWFRLTSETEPLEVPSCSDLLSCDALLRWHRRHLGVESIRTQMQ